MAALGWKQVDNVYSDITYAGIVFISARSIVILYSVAASSMLSFAGVGVCHLSSPGYSSVVLCVQAPS